ncbi:MAG TPA: DUF192 domain-containing protein [Candidatus Paceibacterota bacterium]|nr:DUF192 domain-containing protein [Candidatus Paceibacterota bacterium]
MIVGKLNGNKLMVLVVKTSIAYLIFIVVMFTLPIYKQAYKIFGSAIDEIYASRVVIGETSLTVRIANDSVSRTSGLSNVAELGEKNGVFFIFDQADYHGIWMKDMLFSIDIIWIDQNMEVVHIEQNISPNTFPKTFIPNKKSLYVLETNAGFVKKHGIKIGDVVTRL